MGGLRSPLSGTIDSFNPGRVTFSKGLKYPALCSASVNSFAREFFSNRSFLSISTLLNLVLDCYNRLWQHSGLTFFMLPVLPHPLAAGPVYPFSLPASLGSCAGSINSKFDPRSRHRSAESASPFPPLFMCQNSGNTKLISRSSTRTSTMAQHHMYGTPATSPLVYQQRYCLVVVHFIADSSQTIVDIAFVPFAKR
jgi:hypothetical protein